MNMAALREIKYLLTKLFGVAYDRIDATDHLREDWGIDKRERRRFEEEFVKSFPEASGAPGLNKCQTIEDFARLVG